MTTIYRRQSMAQLYEKLRAQDDDDDTAWLAQFSPDDKFDEAYVPIRPPPVLSAVSSASPVSPCSSGSPVSNSNCDNESSDDFFFDFDSDSDADPEPLPLELPHMGFDSSVNPPLTCQPDDSIAVTGPSDFSYIPPAQETSLLQSAIPPPLEDGLAFPVTVLPEPALSSPSITPRRTARCNQKSSARRYSPAMLHDSSEDVYSESEGNGSEDEYVPSPVLSSKKRQRFARSTRTVASPQKKGIDNPSQKRPRHSPLPRNVQAAPGGAVSPVVKNNPWACPYCKWVQRNCRTPDLKRHIRTHTRLQRPAQWVCCGVPVGDAVYYNIPSSAQPYVWAGEVMIGGCCKEFSRRDALKRHLDNDHISCIGNFSVFASICEDDEA